MGPRKWTPKWGPETGPQNGVLKVDPKMGPLSWKCFDFFLISTTGPLAGCLFFFLNAHSFRSAKVSRRSIHRLFAPAAPRKRSLTSNAHEKNSCEYDFSQTKLNKNWKPPIAKSTSEKCSVRCCVFDKLKSNKHQLKIPHYVNTIAAG